MSLSSNVRFAGFWRRWVAFGLDSVLLSFVTIGIQALMGISPFAVSIAPQSVLHYLGARIVFPYIGVLVVMAGIWAITDGRSPGKWLMGIRIVRADGKRLTLWTALLRYVGYALSSLFFSLGYLWMLWDPDKQTWHDKLAKTYVVMDPSRKTSWGSWLVGLGFPVLMYAVYFWMMLVSRGLVVVPSDLIARYRDMRTVGELAALPAGARDHIHTADAYISEVGTLSATDSAKARQTARLAVEELKLARDAVPQSTIVSLRLATAYMWLDGEPAKQKALENAQNAYLEDPNERSAAYILGRALYNLGRFDEAASMFEKAVSLDHTYKSAYQSLAYTYRQLKQYRKAHADFVSAIDLYTKANDHGQYDAIIRSLNEDMAKLPQ